MTKKLWWEDIAVGSTFALGSDTVDREEAIAFATRYDPQPYHIDDAAGEANPVFGRLSACGPHTFAMTARMTYDGLEPHGIFPMMGGGVDEMRFTQPVYPGDRLSARMTVQDKRVMKSRDDCGIIRMLTTVTNQDDVVVLTFVGTIFIERRDR